jgi:hypothetical protein
MAITPLLILVLKANDSEVPSHKLPLLGFSCLTTSLADSRLNAE